MSSSATLAYWKQIFVVTALLAVSCGEKGSNETDGDADAGSGPLYVVSTVVYSDDNGTGYLATTPSIESGATFDLKSAIEIEESVIAGREGTPFVYAGTLSNPAITRWEVKADGSFEKGPVLSFANLDISYAWPVDPDLFYSDEKAYFTDDASRQVVIWNPSTMKLIDTIKLDVDVDGALQPYLSLTVRQDRIFVTVSWEEDFDHDWSKFGDHVRIITIDPKTDKVVSATDESRCNYLLWSSKQADGTTYFSPMSWYTPIRSMLGEDTGIDSCGLRIVPGGSSFDQGYEQDLSALVGGRPAGTLFLANDDVAFVRVWHSELVTPLKADKSNWTDVINEAGFLWWRWELGSSKAERIPNQDPGSGEISSLFKIEGRRFLPRSSVDYSKTTLDEMDPTGGLRPSLSGPGTIRGVVRVR